MGKLDGQVALISGGARGQGEAQARLFAREGAAVALGDVLEEDGQRVAESINDTGGQAMFQKLDVTEASSWKSMVDETVAQFGRLDIVVNNAGIARVKLIEESSLEDYLEVIRINQLGVWLGMKAAIPALKEAGGGCIINTSSTAGLGRLFGAWRVRIVEVRGARHDEGRRARAGAVQHSRELGASGTDRYADDPRPADPAG